MVIYWGESRNEKKTSVPEAHRSGEGKRKNKTPESGRLLTGSLPNASCVILGKLHKLCYSPLKSG